MNALDSKRRIRLALITAGVDTFSRLAVAASVNRSKLSLYVSGAAVLSESEKDRLAAVLHGDRSELCPAEGR